MAIVNSIYKIPQPRGYSDNTYYVEDRSENSPDYFNIDSFPSVLGGGRHIIRVKGNGANLRINSTIDIEVVDAEGQRIYCEVSDFVDRFNNYHIILEIYDITAQGIATAYLVGEALLDPNGNPIPINQRNKYNVRWAKQFVVFPYERNNAELIFNEPPSVSAAQVSVPARQLTQTTQSAFTFTSVTSSTNILSIEQSNFIGYDRDFASSLNILDSYSRNISIDPLNRPLTVNRVSTFIRQKDEDVLDGSLLSFANRFGTNLIASQPFFTKEHLGGYFEFFSEGTTPQSLEPQLPTGVTVSGSVSSQLRKYNANVVEVINSTTATLNKPLEIVTIDSRGVRSAPSKFTYRKASNFTGSVTYIPHDFTYVTSSVVSDSYVQFTFQDLKPISGEVYRIRTSTKLQQLVGEYKILNDQIITPVEYLTDAEFPNGLNYTRHLSDYRLIGYFATQSVLDNYWLYAREANGNFNYVTGSLNQSVLSDSAVIQASFTQSNCLTTQFYQNYTKDQLYTLSFNLILEPYTELEVFMNSDVLNSFVLLPSQYPKAFIKSENREKTRYSGDYNRFGKFIGKIVNDRPTRKYYGQVLFDFETDSDGFGRPCFRSKTVDYINQSGSAYVSEISIKPYYMNGFTPNLVQFAVPLSTELINATELSQSIDFKIDYFDYTGRQSEYSTYIDDVILNLEVEIPSNTCQAEKVYFTYNSANTDQQIRPR